MTTESQDGTRTGKRAKNFQTWWRLAALALICATWPLAAAAEPRLALIIGNSEYGSEMGRLPNPANDAKLMSDALKSVGFETITLIDADQKSLKRAISDFGQKLTEMGSEATGLFFYAGHGLQVKGTNYLVPVKADIRTEADVDLEAVSADTVLAQMEYAGARVNIVILDACRNNPLARGFRSGTRGLAKMDAPKGSFIAYSTAPGDVAADGTGTNSPYTKALAASIRTPGKGIEEMFREVRGQVLASTGQAQTPWESSSLTAPFYFQAAESSTFQTASAPDAPQATDQTQVAARVIDPVEKEYWDTAKKNNDAAGYEAYLSKYPDGEFAGLAKTELKRVTGGADRSAEEQIAALDASTSIVASQQMLYMKSKGNVRATPAKNGPVLMQLPKNAELNVTGHTADNAWWRVALEGGNVGYVHNSLVVNQPSAPPVAAATIPAPAPAPAPAEATAAETASAPVANEAYVAAPAMSDRGTVTEEKVVTETTGPDTGAQVGSVFGGLLSGFAGGQGNVVIAPQQSTTTQTTRSVAPPDPAPADQKILGQLRSGDINSAFRSASDAQAKDPGFWSKAAMVALHAGKRPDMASNMAQRALQQNPGYLYAALFVALADAAQGGQAAGSAQSGLDSFGQNAWPAPIAELMTGQRDAKSLLALAQMGGQRAVCEAGFYGAVYLKASGDAAGYASLLKAGKAAAKACPEGAATLKLR